MILIVTKSTCLWRMCYQKATMHNIQKIRVQQKQKVRLHNVKILFHPQHFLQLSQFLLSHTVFAAMVI